MFDDATARAQSIPQLGRFASADALAWGATANTLYASRFAYQGPQAQEIDTLQVDASGLSIQSNIDLTGGTDPFGAIRYAGGELYEASGILRDPTSGAVLGQITLPDYSPFQASPEILCVTPDAANSRLFVLVHDYQSSRLLLFVYSLPSLAVQAYIDLGYDSFDVNIATRLILWGSNGIAFNRNGLQILSGTFPGSCQRRHSIDKAVEAEHKCPDTKTADHSDHTARPGRGYAFQFRSRICPCQPTQVCVGQCSVRTSHDFLHLQQLA